ncbi:hypothetical protein [uncultured Brachyspira sp.]|uniref:hypothetical protein n=1 Tax=uncultured Brachyspira sp. TaxID=221953 RepID=UPI0025DBA176|nr:hypothetical protein [uncultured Brachyspira sp.]
MYVKPSNNYKFNKPLFKSEYSNITKSILFSQTDTPLTTNDEVIIPICEYTDIQGVRKFKNTTLQLYSNFFVNNSTSFSTSFPSIIPIPYFLIAVEHSIEDQDLDTDFIISNKTKYFISTNYNDVNSLSTEILNRGTLLFQGLLYNQKTLIQSTRLSKNLDAGECIYLVLKIPDDPVYANFWIQNIEGTVNYSIKYS